MDLLRRAFVDIAAGQSRGPILGRPCYIKHLSHADQLDFDAKYDEFYQEARLEGAPTEAEKIESLKAAGAWSDAKELELTRARQLIDSLNEGKAKNAKMPSMVKAYAKQIADAEKDYRQKLWVKRELIGLTCEVHADHEINDYYIVSNLFEDKELEQPFFRGDFGYLSPEEVSTVISDFNRVLEGCSDTNLKRLAMKPFFQRYFQLAGDDFAGFFGKPICHLTFYQVELLRYGAHFRNIYENHDIKVWPKDVLDDPDLLSNYALTVSKGKEEMQQRGAYDKDAINVGMKAEDAKALGVKQQPSLISDIAAKGGNVMDYFMKQGSPG